jgi:phospholipase C
VADGTIPDHQPCDGVTTALTSDGSIVPLTRSPDVVPVVNHNVQSQQVAIDGGRMDGFDRISGCTGAGHNCLTQFDPSQIPNLAALAGTYVVSDATFEFSTSPSWIGHLVLASANQDGFQGDNPTPSTFTSLRGPGWGCDSYNDAPWWNGTQTIMVPSCIPDRTGAGPYRTSPVPYVPTIFDRLDGAGLSWRLYASEGGDVSGGSAYGAAICPTFYECFGSSQRANWVPTAQAVPDAGAGKLPNVSIVVPTAEISQHNSYSMTMGDDWIGSVVSAIQSGPDWPSTAIFITYDDCGCFYDHVSPPQAGWGIRVPMVIVSPYAVPGVTDSQPATYSSMLAYAEHLFGLAPLATTDANAYDFGGSFDYGAPPSLAPVHLVTRGISENERDWIEAHPGDEGDPT